MPLQCTKIQFLYIKTFDVGGKKVGYLAYSSFDLDSAEKLVDICCQFKQEGISDLFWICVIMAEAMFLRRMYWLLCLHRRMW